MLSDRPLVYIIILSWNNANDVVECLESLRQLDYPNYRVVVVDNGSTDGTVAIVRKRFAEAHLIENNANLGYAEGNNVGIRYALENGAEYVFVLNDDAVVTPGVVLTLVQAGERDPTIGMLGPRVVSYTNRSLEYLGASIDWRTGTPAYAPTTASTICDAEYLAGCALIVKAKVAREIGLFDPIYYCYFEDADWGTRCGRAGYRCVTVPQAKIYHKGTPDNPRHLSMHSRFYYWRNQYLLMRRYAGWRRWLPFLFFYAYQTFNRFYLFARNGETDHADAVMAGFWSSATGTFGAERRDAPEWFKQVIFRAASVLEWLSRPARALQSRFSR